MGDEKPLVLRGYQQREHDRIVDYRSNLIAWDMGTGKTLLAVELMRHISDTPRQVKMNPLGTLNVNQPVRALVIAPLNTHQSWKETIERQMPDTPVYILGTEVQTPQLWERVTSNFHRFGVYIIGWEAMHGYEEKVFEEKTVMSAGKPRTIKVLKKVIEHIPPWKQVREFDLVVADECHRMQNRKSASATVLKSIPAVRRLAMSGTWTGNKKEGGWSTLNWLWPKKYPYYWPWVNAVFDTVPDPYSKIRIIGEKEPGKSIADIPSYSRVELTDVVHDIPEVIERRIEVPMTPKQAKIYRDFKDQAFAWLEDQPVGTNLPIVQRIRLRQVALGTPSAVTAMVVKREVGDVGEMVSETEEEIIEVFFKPNSLSNKINTLKEILSDIPSHEPVMVYLHSKRFAVAVQHQIGRSAVIWSGDTSQTERQKIKDAFGQPNGPRVIVAVISAISTGTDGLQKVCASEVWLSQDENNIENQQAKARLVRSGQSRPVNRWYIESEDTIDQGVYVRTAQNTVEMKRYYRGSTQEEQ